MKASKLVLTIFFGFIFTIVAYLCFYMLSTNHDRGVKDEVHYIPFETPFRHLVVEDGWILNSYLGDGLNMGSDVVMFLEVQDKLTPIKSKITSSGMIFTRYFKGYDDQNLLNKIEIKDDTLFFRKTKKNELLIRSISLNLDDLSSLEISGNSRISFRPKNNSLNTSAFENDSSFIKIENLVVKMSDDSKVTINELEFDNLVVKGQDFSSFSIRTSIFHNEAKKRLHINSDIDLSGNASFILFDSEFILTDYKIKDEAFLLHRGNFVETIYGKKFTKRYKEVNNTTNVTSSSSN